jgi:hypothetical protein
MPWKAGRRRFTIQETWPEQQQKGTRSSVPLFSKVFSAISAGFSACSAVRLLTAEFAEKCGREPRERG